MNEINPFEPPATAATGEPFENFDACSLGTINSQFVLTRQHVVVTLKKYRSTKMLTKAGRWLRYCASLMMILVAIPLLFSGKFVIATIAGLIAVFFIYAHKVDDFLAVRKFRNATLLNKEQFVSLSNDGFAVETEFGNSNTKWIAFSKAVILHDGVLLFRGNNMVNWIPDSSLQTTDGPARIRQLLRAKLPTN